MIKIKKYLIISAVFFSIYNLGIVLIGLSFSPATSDVVVVLGNEVLANGKPSDRLQARLDSAIDVYNNKLAQYIIVSGGVGKSGYDEARVMASYLVDKKIDTIRVIIDSNGVNTKATAENAAKIMKERKFNSVIIASQYFHLPRCYFAFYKIGISNISAIYPRYFEIMDIFSTFRESIAIIKYLIIL